MDEKTKAKKLIEGYLTNEFMFHIDDAREMKRPFGNSGTTQIFKDMCEILDEKIKYNVSCEDEIYDKQSDFVDYCFSLMEKFANDFGEKYEVKLIKK